MAAADDRLCKATPHGVRCVFPRRNADGFCAVHSPEEKRRQDAERAAEADRQRDFENFDRIAKLTAKPKPKRNMLTVAVDGFSGGAEALASPRLSSESPVMTPKLEYSRKDAPIEGGVDERVTWRGSLSVVLDIDETLVAALEGHPNMPTDALDMHELVLDDGIDDGRMKVALRPWATRFLHHLVDQNFEVYLLTAGSAEYADAIMKLFNKLATDAGERPTIIAAASCRDARGRVQLKEFSQVLPAGVLDAFAIAVDNKRLCWKKECRDQVVITADFLPEWTRGQKETVLMQVLDRILHITYFFEQHYAETQEFKPVGEILASLYERDIKQSMMDRSTRFKFTHPEVTAPNSFLSFLDSRDS